MTFPLLFWIVVITILHLCFGVALSLFFIHAVKDGFNSYNRNFVSFVSVIMVPLGFFSVFVVLLMYFLVCINAYIDEIRTL